MDIRFRWHMFITSFIPLWFSILLIDIWNIIDEVARGWNNECSVTKNIYYIFLDCLIPIVSIVVIFIVVGASMLVITRFLKYQKDSTNQPDGTITKAKRANKLTSEFLLAYILPMIAFDFTDLKDITLFLIYFIVLAILCIRNSNVYTNIFLEFLGYKMYDCDIECKSTERPKVYSDSLIISKDDLTARVGQKIKYWDFDKYIYINLNN